MSLSHKRPLSRSPTPSPAHSPSISPLPCTKAARTTSATSDTPSLSHPLLCTLPPTCNPPHRPTPLADSSALESHYATYHAHVCEQPGCRCVFPDARLLELHQTECHDPIAAVRKERGEKIFACHLPTCPRVFSTPKTRRLHLIQVHGYPKEYFFAVTNKGIGELLRKWGEGVSLVRGKWKSRSESGMDVDELDEDERPEEAGTDEPWEKEHLMEEGGGRGGLKTQATPQTKVHTQTDAKTGRTKQPDNTRTYTHQARYDTNPTDTTISVPRPSMPISIAMPVPTSPQIERAASTSSGWLSGTPLVEDSSPSSSEPSTPERNATTACDKASQPRTARNDRRHEPVVVPAQKGDKNSEGGPNAEGEDEALAHALGSLALVPPSVRSGRGASRTRGGRGQGHAQGLGRGGGRGQEPRGQTQRKDGEHEDIMDVDDRGGQGKKAHRGRQDRAMSVVGASSAQPGMTKENAPASTPPSATATATDTTPGSGLAKGGGRGRPPMPPRGLGRGGRGRLSVGMGFRRR